MATPNEKLAASLSALQELQADGRHVFRSKELTRVHRERLLRNGFLRKVMKGWVISTSPGVSEGVSTPWYASFWEFCAAYFNERFGPDWYLSPEQSLLLAAENTVVPTQAIIYSPRGTNNTIQLLFGTSLFDLKQPETLSSRDMVVREGLRLFSPEAALIRVPEAFFARFPTEAQIVLASVHHASDVLRRLLDGGHSVVAGRLAGAFRRIGHPGIADEFLTTMRSAGYDVREKDPFVAQQTFGILSQSRAPIAGRIEAIWHGMRDAIVEVFPTPPGLPKDKKTYLKVIDGLYPSDAYHSLSIEGYQVSAELIEGVRSGDWNPDVDDVDRENRDALAARGYWQAFQLVKKAVAKIIGGENPAVLVRKVHQDWYRELFQPSVAAGLLERSALAGYRNDSVFIRGSRHVPPRWEAVRDAMPALFDLLQEETEPGVRAVLSHWLFGYVHPYPDGNGRMARFVMNAMLASGGYPWAVVRLEDRTKYMAALESASVENDIRPFARFLAECVRSSLGLDEAG